MSLEWSEIIWCDKCGQTMSHIFHGDDHHANCSGCGDSKVIIRGGKKIKAIPLVTLTHGGPERRV